MKLYRNLVLLDMNNKKEIQLPIGKSWYVLFLGPIALFYRGQWLLGLLSILTLFIANFYFFHTANDKRIKKYIRKGWVFINDF